MLVVNCVECLKEDKYDKNWKVVMGLGSIEVIGDFIKNNFSGGERLGVGWSGLSSKCRGGSIVWIWK